MKRILFILSLCVISIDLMSQGTSTDCSRIFMQAYGKIKAFQKAGSQSLNVGYSLNIITNDDKSYTDKIELKMHSKKVKVISREVSLYQDQSTLVAIQHKNNTILLSRPIVCVSLSVYVCLSQCVSLC